MRAGFRVALVLAVGLLLSEGLVPATDAGGAVVAQWTAKIGNHGSMGSVTVQGYVGGAGTFIASLKALRRATTYGVAVYRGTCSKPSRQLLVLPSMKTSAHGTVTRSFGLSARQMSLLKTGGDVVRLVAGQQIVCGVLAKVAIPSSNPPNPLGTPPPVGATPPPVGATPPPLATPPPPLATPPPVVATPPPP